MLNELFLGVGVFGIFGMSLLCPLVAPFWRLFRREGVMPSDRKADMTAQLSRTVSILLPAHNEDATIKATLDSIQEAIAVAMTTSSRPLDARIIVGLDGCTDRTAEIVKSYSRVIVQGTSTNQGKWRTLEALLAGVSSEWTIFADAGIQWPTSFLSDFLSVVDRKPQALAIAPSYRPARGGLLSRVIWGIEVFLKTCEGWSGGPVSLHGATVGYQTTALKSAIRRLSGHVWLNDDVVIPLMIRSLFPQGVIVYPVGQVRDIGVRVNQVDIRRRKRMLRGNLQWIRMLWPGVWRLNGAAGVLATRRVFRLLWAYWFVALAIGFGLMYPMWIVPTLAVVSALAVLSGSIRQLAGAAWVSLATPWDVLKYSPFSEGVWS